MKKLLYITLLLFSLPSIKALSDDEFEIEGNTNLEETKPPIWESDEFRSMQEPLRTAIVQGNLFEFYTSRPKTFDDTQLAKRLSYKLLLTYLTYNQRHDMFYIDPNPYWICKSPRRIF